MDLSTRNEAEKRTDLPQYLNAEDLFQKPAVSVTISNVIESPWDDGLGNKKLGVFFEGKVKGLCLNKGNEKILRQTYGDDTVAWTGCIIELYAELVNFDGGMVPGMKVRIPVPSAKEGEEVPF